MAICATTANLSVNWPLVPWNRTLNLSAIWKMMQFAIINSDNLVMFAIGCQLSRDPLLLIRPTTTRLRTSKNYAKIICGINKSAYRLTIIRFVCNSKLLALRIIAKHYFSQVFYAVSAAGNACGRVCLSLMLHSSSWNPWPKIAFFVIRYIFTISRSSSYIKVTGSRSRLQEQNVIRAYLNMHIRGWSVFDCKTLLFGLFFGLFALVGVFSLVYV